MLVRIVRMTFEAQYVNDFKELFEQSQPKILNMPGCHNVELFRDWNEKHVFITYSHWDDQDALDHYRHSAMFKDVWQKTKAMFAGKPLAFSMKQE